jgi:bis(5'-nucleosidyl)-tetraphosphatase
MERSFGIIPLKPIGEQWMTLLVKHGKGHWAFPKGHADEGESPEQAASRELFEETALRIVRFLPDEPLKEFYLFKRQGILVEKMVTYFLAEVEGVVRIQAEEINDFKWITFEEASKLATFPETKKLCQEALKRM